MDSAHHKSAPALTSMLVHEFLAINKTVITIQPSWRHFATIDEIKSESKKELTLIPKSAFQKCFEDWKNRCHKCIISEGNYFKGDKIHIDEQIRSFQKNSKFTFSFEHTSYMYMYRNMDVIITLPWQGGIDRQKISSSPRFFSFNKWKGDIRSDLDIWSLFMPQKIQTYYYSSNYYLPCMTLVRFFFLTASPSRGLV